VLAIITGGVPFCGHHSDKNFERAALVTISEQALTRVQPRETLIVGPEGDKLSAAPAKWARAGLFGFRNKAFR
jgi:hypothetical protein